MLFPSANEIDAMDTVPRERLDLLAELGWYGLSASSSGIDIVGGRPIVEAFAAGCLTTSLVWMQHLGQPPACEWGAEHLRRQRHGDAPLRRRPRAGRSHDELVQVRADLDAGDATTFPDGRAAACELAVRAASMSLVASGSGAVEVGTHAERLYREAAMLLVFGSRPSIRASLLTAIPRAR